MYRAGSYKIPRANPENLSYATVDFSASVALPHLCIPRAAELVNLPRISYKRWILRASGTKKSTCVKNIRAPSLNREHHARAFPPVLSSFVLSLEQMISLLQLRVATILKYIAAIYCAST